MQKFIRETIAEVRKYFPTEVLEITDTPEDDILLNIHTSLKPDEALTLLNEFDESWFLDNMSRGQGRFNVILRFVKKEIKDGN